jgi:hypothetical protein
VRRWLITVSSDRDLEDLRTAVAAVGGTMADDPPIPLGAGEQVVEADGPDDLRDRLSAHPGVMKVSPDTPKHPFG